MINYINLSKSEIKPLPYLSDIEYQNKFKKGWSYSYVYHFSEIRNVYILLRKYGFHDLKTFSQVCFQNKLPTDKTPWNERRILEHVNALKNFGLVSDNGEALRSDIFLSPDLTEPISTSDRKVFKELFFSYYRFKEILSWFIDPVSSNREKIIAEISPSTIASKSLTIFPFSSKSRFTDSFIYELKNNTTIYRIQNGFDDNEDMMRFWDVFIKWASELELIEKFNLKNLDYQLAENYKSLSCVFFKNDIDPKFDLLSFININYKSNYINVPKLIFRLVTTYRFSISEIKNLIIKVSNENSQKLSLQRTSEIFIRDTEINFVPKINDSYISHLLLADGTRKPH